MDPLPGDHFWAELQEIVRFCPTPHNTQPFRLRILAPDRAEVLLVADRMLHRSDPGNRYVAGTLGILARYAEEAAKALGWTLLSEPDFDFVPTQLTPTSGLVPIAQLCVTGATDGPRPDTARLRNRRTSRMPYEPRPIAQDHIATWEAMAREVGHRCLIEQDSQRVRMLLHQNAIAIIDNQNRPDDYHDIKPWIRYGNTPTFGDGLWQVPFNQSALDLQFSFLAPRLLTWPVLKPLAIARYLQSQRGTPAIGLVCGPFDSWPEVYAGGRLLGDLWLAMHDAGAYMHPLGSLLTNPHHAAWLARACGVEDCWFIFRCGYAAVPPPSPRLRSILVD